LAELDEYGVALLVGAVLDALGIEYTLGGSLASYLHGEPRSTNNIDFAVRLEEHHVPQFVERLGPEFVVDPDARREAVRDRRPYAMYFLPLVLKVDLFIRGSAPLDQSEFARRIAVRIGDRERLYSATPEDNLLRKLLWFRDGGEISDRQWRDVLGILRVSGASLDRGYLERWADQLGLRALLQRAFEQAERSAV
jgi:hypothetical protein